MSRIPKSEYWQQVKKSVGDQPFFSLAPMEAVTNSVFRQVVTQAAEPDLYYTEFINAIAINHEKAKFSVAGRMHLETNQKTPIAQIWAGPETDFKGAALTLKEKGFAAIDLNMGCPDATVIKNHAGSDYIRNFDDAKKIIENTKEAELPVSVKTRLGFSDVKEFRKWIPFVLEQDVEVLTIHLRSRKEMSNPNAHYEFIDEIIQMRDEISANTLLQINGDIKNRQQGLQLTKEHPGIDGIMIGRGIFENPFAFETENEAHTHQDMIDLLNLHLDLYDDYIENVGYLKFESLRRFFKIYVRGFSNATQLRIALMETKTTDEVRQILVSDLIKSHI